MTVRAVLRTGRRRRGVRSRAAGAVLPWAAVATAGFVVGWWMGRTSAGDPDRGEEIDEGWADRWGERVDAAMEAAAGGMRYLERRWRGPAKVDVALLRSTLAGVEGGGRLEAGVLGAGLVEVVGESSEEAAAEAVRRLRALPGVRVVVDRIWTPASARPEAR